jgi:2-polyprenyl-3-methyl-5-hydroxy-6-metoxy-1,4-benzoquinol methylase
MWTTSAVSDVIGPADNVRNYLERRMLRTVLNEITRGTLLQSACEVGCGYGRITMLLGEFAKQVVGFEREQTLIDIGSALLPTVQFQCVDNYCNLADKTSEQFDLSMTCAFLQHLTDDDCRMVLQHMRTITQFGHIILTEKTSAIAVTDRSDDGSVFLSRARTVDAYAALMKPFDLVNVCKRELEPTYHNSEPGSCMVFRSPSLGA